MTIYWSDGAKIAAMRAGLKVDRERAGLPPDGVPTPEQAALMAKLEAESEGTYRDMRLLPDGTICCTCELVTTRAVLIGLDEHGWEHRFCYQDRVLATVALHLLESAESEPLPGYVSSRHAPGAKHALTFTPVYRKPKE